MQFPDTYHQRDVGSVDILIPSKRLIWTANSAKSAKKNSEHIPSKLVQLTLIPLTRGRKG